MKRFFIFISLHLLLFLIVIAYQVQASEDGWTIVEGNKDYSFKNSVKEGKGIFGDNDFNSKDYKRQKDSHKQQDFYKVILTLTGNRGLIELE